MPATEIPPRNPPSSSPQVQLADNSADIYDARRWESAYREMHDVPTILVQLQDELARSRKQEAFWASVVVHLIVIILIWNSPKFEKYFPKHDLDVAPLNALQKKDLTYLELPPDEQKVAKRPNTNIISDKDRNAMSRTPHLDAKELRKILDSSRPGAPGPSVPPQVTPPAPAAAAQGAPAQQPAPPSPQPDQNQMAQMQQPTAAPRPSFNTGPMTAGSAIEQAARAAAAGRGSYGGSNGDYGLGQGRRATGAIGPLDILSDTMGVDFGPYLARVLHDVKQNWYNLIPESAMLGKRGKVSIEFAILKDGRVAGMALDGTSGDVSLDRAAWGGITASNPFPPLPSEFGGQYLTLRFHFYYNPDKGEMQ
jgi:TonB family protein